MNEKKDEKTEKKKSKENSGIKKGRKRGAGSRKVMENRRKKKEDIGQ